MSGSPTATRSSHRGLVGDVGLDEPSARTKLSGQRLALLTVEVGDRHRCAALVQAPDGRLAEAGSAAADQR